MEVIEQIPKTALDVFRLLPEGTLCDVIDNVLYMSPAPKYTHQRLLGLIFKNTLLHVEKHHLGEVFISPVDVYLASLQSAVQPDLIFVSTNNQHIMAPDGYFYGAPDLIVEVLSADRKRDTIKKKNLYEKAGVKEYFIVDPENNRVLAYTLLNGTYQLAYDNIGIFTSTILQCQFTF